MALLGTVEKQPREIIDFDILYAKFLAGRTDSITSVTTEIFPSGALTIPYTNISGTTVKVAIAGGIDGESYKVTVITVTEAGLLLEDEVTVFVQEV